MIVGHPGATTIVKVDDPVQRFASVAVTVNVNVPALVGVPVRFAPERVRPAGTLTRGIEYVYGPVPPLAEKLVV